MIAYSSQSRIVGGVARQGKKKLPPGRYAAFALPPSRANTRPVEQRSGVEFAARRDLAVAARRADRIGGAQAPVASDPSTAYWASVNGSNSLPTSSTPMEKSLQRGGRSRSRSGMPGPLGKQETNWLRPPSRAIKKCAESRSPLQLGEKRVRSGVQFVGKELLDRCWYENRRAAG
jgi:hypothetical protein